MTHDDLVELSDHHHQQAAYFRKVGDAVKDAAITKRHYERADWHARHAQNLDALAKSFATGFPTAVAASKPAAPVAALTTS
jgi:hypothetical protein